MPAEKRWLAVVTWTDGDIFDADEFSVFADSADTAKARVRLIWAAANMTKHPHCRIEEIDVFPLPRLHALA
jgi:hypothetical protein